MITVKTLERPLNARQLSPTGGPAFMLCFFSGFSFPKIISQYTDSLCSIKDILLFSYEHS